MKYTIEDAKNWAVKHSDDLDKARLSHEDPTMQMMSRMMGDRLKPLYDSGEWLHAMLVSDGATEKQANDICFAQGQRAFGGCPWNAAVNYANEFAQTGDTEEKGGLALADKRNAELFGTKEVE